MSSRKTEFKYRKQTGRAPGTFSSHRGKKAVKLTGSGAGCLMQVASAIMVLAAIALGLMLL